MRLNRITFSYANRYIGVWDLSVLRKEREVWSVACSQVFFSISLTFGLLTSFGSHCKRDEPVFLNSCVVIGLNSMYSFVTGFAVFCALGHLAHLEGVSISDLPYSGFSLVFGTWPVVLGTLPGGIHWVRLLFFNLFLLGIDSAFAFTECKSERQTLLFCKLIVLAVTSIEKEHSFEPI